MGDRGKKEGLDLPCDYQQVRAVPKHPNRKKKKAEEYKGVKIPHKKKRSAISKEEYQRALDHYGSECFICHRYPIQLHHRKFRSQGGYGGYRNLIPLCKTHHDKAHRSYEFAEYLRHLARVEFGEFYYYDKWKCWKEGLISSPEDDKFESFMEQQKNLLDKQ